MLVLLDWGNDFLAYFSVLVSRLGTLARRTMDFGTLALNS